MPRCGRVRSITILACVLAGLSLPSTTVLAQDARPDSTPQTYVYVDTPLVEALQSLISASRIELLYDPDLVAGRTSRCRITTPSPTLALRCMLERTGLDFVTLSSGVHVLIQSAMLPPALGHVVGQVVEQGSNAPVARASILDESSGLWTTSDEAGRFVLGDLPSGPHALSIRHVAYQVRLDTIWVSADERAEPLIRMVPRVHPGPTVIVSGLEPLHGEPTQVVDYAGLMQDVRSMSAGALSGADRLVGVRAGFDGTGAHIEGGEPGDNLLRLDGAPVFDPIRNGGFFSAFNPLAVKRLTVLRTGYAAREGSSLAGGILAEHLLRSDLEPNVVVQASPLAVDGRAAGSFALGGGRKVVLRDTQGPAPPDSRRRVDWMTAARRTLGRGTRPQGLKTRFREWSLPDNFLAETLFDADPDSLEMLADLLDGQPMVLSSSDFHAAARARLGDGRQLYGSFFFADNRFGSEALDLEPSLLASVSDEYVWRNRTALLRYNWILGSYALMQVEGWNSLYRMQHPFRQVPLGSGSADLDFNEIVTSGLVGRANIAVGGGRTVVAEVGIHQTEAEARMAVHPALPEKQVSSEAIHPAVWTWHGLLDADIPVGRTVMTAGTRLTYIPIRQTVYAEPRLSVRHDWPLVAAWAVSGKFSTGLFRQYMNQFDVASWSFSAVLPTFRVWMPLGEHQRPATSWHAAVDLSAVRSEGYSLAARAFHRRQLRILGLDRSDSPDLTEEGSGWASGFSVSVKAEWSRIQAGAAYARTWAEQEFLGRFGGASMPVQWLQPHVLEGSVRFRLGEWSISSRAEWVLGRAWAFRRAYYDYLSLAQAGRVESAHLADPALDGLPAYFQLDLGTSRSWPLTRGRLVLRLDVLNALGRSNVIERRFDGTAAYDVFGLPRIPTVTIRAEL